MSGGTWYGSEGAFYNCTNLEKILIPDSVATINKYAFEGCDKLTIYGNDGMASKKYAEENDINFDYISNWNKQNSGADVTPPTVKSMQVAYDSIKNYSKDNAKEMYMVSTGAKLTIKVNFSENIKGTTVPTLTIKIGNGQNIQLTQGTIGGATITYTYTLKSTDKGVISVVSFTGGNITDNAGNSATLSVKTLTEEYGSYLINANGTADNTNNSGNTNSGTNAGQQNSNTQNNNTQNDNNAQNGNGTAEGTQNNTQNIKDTTTAVGKLPQTGVGIGLLASIVLILFGSIFAYFKLRNLKGI